MRIMAMVHRSSTKSMLPIPMTTQQLELRYEIRHIRNARRLNHDLPLVRTSIMDSYSPTLFSLRDKVIVGIILDD